MGSGLQNGRLKKKLQPAQAWGSAPSRVRLVTKVDISSEKVCSKSSSGFGADAQTLAEGSQPGRCRT